MTTFRKCYKLSLNFLDILITTIYLNFPIIYITKFRLKNEKKYENENSSIVEIK